jgi:hypothetical protein
MRFKYKTLGNNKIPLLDIIITNPENNQKVAYKALLDSGAFMNVFHSDIATVLGINLSKIKKEIQFGGVNTQTGILKGKPYVLTIMVVQKGKSHSFDAYILFSDNINSNGHPLLGRQGFFDQFSKVEFNLRSSEFCLYI